MNYVFVAQIGASTWRAHESCENDTDAMNRATLLRRDFVKQSAVTITVFAYASEDLPQVVEQYKRVGSV